MKRKITIILSIIALTLVSSVFLIACDGGEYEKDEYDMQVAINPHTKTAECTTRIKMTYREERADNLRLLMNSGAFTHAMPVEKIDFKAAYPAGESYGKVTITACEADGKTVESALNGNVLTLKTGTVNRGDRIEVRVSYKLDLPHTALRYGYNAQSINLANFYPQNARIEEYDPIGDPFYSYAADYKVSVSYPAEATVLASGDKVSADEQDGLATDIYEASNIRDFAIVLSEKAKLISANDGGIEVNYAYIEDRKADKTLATALNSIKVFSELFGKYPYKTFNVCETQFINGGMEYSGLIYVANNLDSEERERVVIHEAAHQWWYGLVGSDQINHSFQDEGLTEYSVILYYRAIGEEDKAAKLLWEAKSQANSYKMINSGLGVATDERIDRPLNEFINSGEYVYAVYVKGQLLFNYICECLGEDKFLQALREYQGRYRFAIAAPNDIIDIFEEKLGGMRLMINSWLEGKVIFL